MLTKGNLTRDEWNHLLCLFNMSHFSSTVCSDTMAKRSQQDSGEKRVTAKSRPMMNLDARTPSLVSSSTSVSPGKRNYGSQDPWKSVAGEDRSGRSGKGTDLFEASYHHYHEQLMESFSSASYSKVDDDRAWSSQEWRTEITTYGRLVRPDKTSWRMVRKVRPCHEEILLDGTAQSVRNEEVLRDRSGRPDDINSQEVARPQNFVMGKRWNRIGIVCRIKIIRESDEWSSAKKTEKNFQCYRKWRRTFYDLGECLRLWHCNQQYSWERISKTIVTPLWILQISTLKQMFDISAKWVSEQEEISGLETIGWENHSWKYMSLIGDERIINLQRTKVYVFSDSVLCLGRIHQNPESNKAWEQRIGWITFFQSLERLWRNRWRADEIRVEHLPRI